MTEAGGFSRNGQRSRHDGLSFGLPLQSDGICARGIGRLGSANKWLRVVA